MTDEKTVQSAGHVERWYDERSGRIVRVDGPGHIAALVATARLAQDMIAVEAAQAAQIAKLTEALNEILLLADDCVTRTGTVLTNRAGEAAPQIRKLAYEALKP